MAWRDLAGVAARTIERSSLAETVTVTPLSGDPETVDAIFDEAFKQQELTGEGVVNSTRPLCDVRLAALTFAPARGMTVTARSRSFEVTSVEPDGHGNAKLFGTET